MELVDMSDCESEYCGSKARLSPLSVLEWSISLMVKFFAVYEESRVRSPHASPNMYTNRSVIGLNYGEVRTLSDISNIVTSYVRNHKYLK